MPHLPPAAIRPEDRVPRFQKIIYGLGNTAELYAVWLFKSVATPVFNIGLGLSPALISWAFVIFRLWDAMTDPVMGWISDNARTRWGRRRPFIVIGAILTGMIFPLMWLAPSTWSDGALFAYLVGMGIVFYTCFTVWAMPYQSLMLEMTPDYRERTHVASYRAMMGKITGLTLAWAIPAATWLAVKMEWFKADGFTPDLAAGMKLLSVPIGVAIAVFGMLPGLFVQERYFQSVARQTKVKTGLFTGLRQTMQNRSFRVITAVAVCFSLGGMMVGSMGFYVSNYYVFAGDLKASSQMFAQSQTLGFVTGLAAIPLYNWMADRWGKICALQIGLVASGLGYLSTYLLYNREHPELMLLAGALISPAMAGLWVIVPSLNADVVDEDELAHGTRREGSFAAIFSWLLKFGQTLAIAISGPLLVWTGFNAKLGPIQSPESLQAMRLILALVPAASYFAALGLLFLYPLTAERVAEIRRALEARRGTV